MGVLSDASLVVKHTFLEYIIPDRAPKDDGCMVDTEEFLESVGLITISPTTAARAAAELRLANERAQEHDGQQYQPQQMPGALIEASPLLKPMASPNDWWPTTPMLDSVFEPAGFGFYKGLCGLDLMGNDGMPSGLMEEQLWLPDAAMLDGAEQQMMYNDASWFFVPFGEYGECCGWQDACWSDSGLWPAATSSTASGDAESVAGSSELEGHVGAGEQRTTMMLRNLPKTFSREMLLRQLDSMGFAGQYDFVYVPVDFSTGVGLGYAFINVCLPGAISKIWEAFDGMHQWEVECDNVCTVSWSDPHQGLAAHIERYQNSPVMHVDVPDEWKPALYVHGMRVDFPPPSKKIKAPKVRSKKSEAAN